MRNVSKDNITEVFMGFMGPDMDPRLREVMESLVRHLHSVARAVGGDMRRDFDAKVLLVEGLVKNLDGKPIPGATLDIWQTAPNGLYSSRDPEQDTYSFHGLQTVDADGRYAFTTVKPVEYTVPSDGPAGDILRACGRHSWRPSHLHFIAEAEGFRPLVTEVFPEGDPYLDQDTVFGVREDLVMRYQAMPAGSFPEGSRFPARFRATI